MTRTLATWLTLLLAVFWGLAVLISGFVIRHELDEAYDSALEETALRLAPLLADEFGGGRDLRVPELSDPLEGGGDRHFVYQLRGADGAVLARSRDAPQEGFGAPLRPGFADTASHRVFTVRAGDPPLFVQTANPFAERREAATEAARTLALPLLALIPASGLAALLAVRRSLKPLSQLRGEIARRGKGDLSPLVPEGVPRELVPIVRSMNRLLGRLKEAIEAERAFAANGAHELRTPVAGALAQAQRLVADLPGGPHRDRARLVAAAVSRLGRISEKLLQMARADSGLGASAAPIDVLAVVRLVAEEFDRRREYAGRIRLELGEGRMLLSPVDQDALAIVVRNLIENALVHGSDEAEVIVRPVDRHSLSVRNASPVIPREILEKLTSRFHRGPTASSGAGLGLAIVSRLLRSMGATLELHSPARGGEDGFEALVRFRTSDGWLPGGTPSPVA